MQHAGHGAQALSVSPHPQRLSAPLGCASLCPPRSHVPRRGMCCSHTSLGASVSCLPSGAFTTECAGRRSCIERWGVGVAGTCLPLLVLAEPVRSEGPPARPLTAAANTPTATQPQRGLCACPPAAVRATQRVPRTRPAACLPRRRRHPRRHRPRPPASNTSAAIVYVRPLRHPFRARLRRAGLRRPRTLCPPAREACIRTSRPRSHLPPPSAPSPLARKACMHPPSTP